MTTGYGRNRRMTTTSEERGTMTTATKMSPARLYGYEARDRDEQEPERCPHCKDLKGFAYGWHRRKGPMPLLEKWRGRRAGMGVIGGWVDHLYRERWPDVPGGWIYVAEPYQLEPEDMAELGRLAGEGWRVEVTAWRAMHYPGHTLAVTLIPPGEWDRRPATPFTP